MYYLIITQDIDDSLALRESARDAHRQRLHELREQGRLLTAGPLPKIDSPDPGAAGFSGSAIIAEFDSLEDASSWAAADPFVDVGVYKDVTVKPYKKIF